MQAVRHDQMARKRTRTSTEDIKEEGDIIVSKKGSSVANSPTPAKGRRSGRLSGGKPADPVPLMSTSLSHTDRTDWKWLYLRCLRYIE